MFFNRLKNGLKILQCENKKKYLKFACKFMLSYLEGKSNTVNCASKVKELLSSLGLIQGVGNKITFLREVKLRFKDNFV